MDFFSNWHFTFQDEAPQPVKKELFTTESIVILQAEKRKKKSEHIVKTLQGLLNWFTN